MIQLTVQILPTSIFSAVKEKNNNIKTAADIIYYNNQSLHVLNLTSNASNLDHASMS